MDMEFKTEEEKWEFCAKMHEKFKHAFENKAITVPLESHELFRLVRVLEGVYYSEEKVD